MLAIRPREHEVEGAAAVRAGSPELEGRRLRLAIVGDDPLLGADGPRRATDAELRDARRCVRPPRRPVERRDALGHVRRIGPLEVDLELGGRQ